MTQTRLQLVTDYELFPQSSEAEYKELLFEADILSNGFKLR